MGLVPAAIVNVALVWLGDKGCGRRREWEQAKRERHEWHKSHMESRGVLPVERPVEASAYERRRAPRADRAVLPDGAARRAARGGGATIARVDHNRLDEGSSFFVPTMEG